MPTQMQAAACQARTEIDLLTTLHLFMPFGLVDVCRHGAFCTTLAWAGRASQEAARGAAGGHEGKQAAASAIRPSNYTKAQICVPPCSFVANIAG
jgi:hypothetical protein